MTVANIRYEYMDKTKIYTYYIHNKVSGCELDLYCARCGPMDIVLTL